MSRYKKNIDRYSGSSRTHFEELSNVLCKQGIIKEPIRRGFFGNLIEGQTMESQSLRWLASERSRIANLFIQSPNLSHEEKVALIRDKYGTTLGNAIVPVIEDMGLSSLVQKATTMNLAPEERVMLLLQLGLIAEAIPQLREMRSQSYHSKHNQIIIINNLAYCLAKLEKSELQEAFDLAQEAMDMAQEDELKAMTNDTLALILFKMGDYNNALSKVTSAYESYSRLDREMPMIHYRFWQIYQKIGEITLAEHHLRLACKLVGGPRRLGPSVSLIELAVGEDEVAEIIDDWLAANGALVRLACLFEQELRPSFRNKVPESEQEISDMVETILRAASVDCLREGPRMSYSAKEYVPDFLAVRLNTIVEIKFVSTKPAMKRIIAEINDDKAAYLSNYPRVLFIIYDLGFIIDVLQFTQGLEEVGVQVLVIKQ